jgi:hypothetical protein
MLKRFETSLAIAGLIILSMVTVTSAHAQAAIQITHGPTTWTLYTSTGTVVSRGHASEAACYASITQPGTYRPCTPVGSITAVGVCTNNTPPPPVVVDDFTLRGTYAPVACPNDHVSFTQTQPVHEPWSTTPQSCAWVDKPVLVVNCDGLKVAPLLEDADTNTTQVEEPGPYVEGLDVEYPLGAPCPAAANGNCYAARWVVTP